MNIATMLNMSKLDNHTVQRIGDVLMAAVEFGDHGVIDWAARAAQDAREIGQLRTRDTETLVRLERIYSNGFYSRNRRGTCNGVGLQAA